MTARPRAERAAAGAGGVQPGVLAGARRLTPAIALCLLSACQAAPEPTAASTGQFPALGWPPPRMRAPSTERPAWLPTLPPNLPRYPVPESWQDTLG